MEPRSKATSAPGSTSFCPACNKPVDALRAGQVAIIDGGFRYFCDATCKNAYVDARSKRSVLDAMMTADPPPVASAARSAQPPTVVSGVRDATITQPSFPAVRGRAEEPPEVAMDDEPEPIVATATARIVPPVAPRDEEDEEDSHGLDESPSTLRSPSQPELELPAPSSERGRRRLEPKEKRESAKRAVVERILTLAPIAGVCLGVLASVVSLAGEPAGALRLPLALAAAVIAIACRAMAPRDRSEPGRWVVLVALGGATVVAIVSAALRHPRTDGHATFVGLAAAAALAVDILVSRARRDVVAARARTNSALAVTARVVRGDGVVEVDASSVKPGEQVVVESGETIPVDGIVVAAGEAEVAPWLDSPVLVQKREGDAVVAGAVVVSGRLRVNATFSGTDRAWLRLTQPTPTRIEVAAPLVAFVRSAVERGAPAAAVLIAGAVYADNGSWLDVAMAACAGGYALASTAAVAGAALAHARGHVAAQRHGIVYKDADAFDRAARADVAVVCSRGTILLGEPEIVVVEAITKDGVSSQKWLRTPPPNEAGPPAAGATESDIARVLAIAAGAEMSSTHPFASAILREARARGIRPDNVRSALGHSGLGVTALSASGDRVIVGSRAFLLQEKVSVAIADARASELEAQGRSVLLVAVGGRLCGLLALQDGLRPGARAAVQRLHDAHIEPVLLSGEARDTCETIARALDIEHVRPEILPSDRAAEVRALADDGRIVAALGHASSDDGALGAADVSIAMGAAGSAPGEWGVPLASDDVRDAALSLTIPRACRDRARVALVVGFVAQAIGAFGIAFGVMPPSLVPVLAFLAAAAVVSIVRDPAIPSDVR
jgi:cation transport ATPase